MISPVRVIPCDASVGEVRNVLTAGDVQQLPSTGGRGTDVRVGLERAAQLRPVPHIALIVLLAWLDDAHRNHAEVGAGYAAT